MTPTQKTAHLAPVQKKKEANSSPQKEPKTNIQYTDRVLLSYRLQENSKYHLCSNNFILFVFVVPSLLSTDMIATWERR